MAGKRPPLLIIGLLPPSPCMAAYMTYAAALALKDRFEVTCVVPDLAPQHLDIADVRIIRMRDLAADPQPFRTARRLYVIGGNTANLPVLQMLHRATGPMLLAATSLFPLVRPYLDARKNWPDGYIDWMQETYGDAGRTLVKADLLRHRTAPAIGHEIDGLQLLLGKACDLIVPSPWAATRAKAGGMPPSLVLPLPACPGPTPGAAQTDAKEWRVLYHGLSEADIRGLGAQTVAAGPKAVSLTALTHTQDALAQVRRADAFLCGQVADFVSPMAAMAIAAGKSVILPATPGTMHLSGPSVFKYRTPGCLHDMATAIAAAGSAPADTGDSGFDALAGTEALASHLLGLDAVSPLPDAAATTPHRARKASAGSGRVPRAILKGAAVLVGDVPPFAIVKAALPEIDLANTLKFATPSVAARLAALADMPVETALNSFGYEATVIDDGDPENYGLPMKPEAWQAVAPFLRHAGQALGFGLHRDIESVWDGEKTFEATLSARILAARQTIRLPERKKGSKAPESGNLPDAGLFWRYDPTRTAVRLIVMTGFYGSVQLLLPHGMPTCMVALPNATITVSPGKARTLDFGNSDILDLQIAAVLPGSGELADVRAMHDLLAEHGLILKWCRHD